MVIESNNNKKGVTPRDRNMNKGAGSVCVFINRKVVEATAPAGFVDVLIKRLVRYTYTATAPSTAILIDYKYSSIPHNRLCVQGAYLEMFGNR